MLKEDKWNWKERWDFGAIITLLKDFSLSIIQEEQLLYHHPRLIVFLFSCFMSCSMIWLFLLLCWPYLGDKRQIKSDKKNMSRQILHFQLNSRDFFFLYFRHEMCSFSEYICQVKNAWMHICEKIKNFRCCGIKVVRITFHLKFNIDMIDISPRIKCYFENIF